jgi:hypothetical protein
MGVQKLVQSYRTSPFTSPSSKYSPLCPLNGSSDEGAQVSPRNE